MNIRSNPDTTLPAVTTGPLPSSRKIFVTPDEAPDVRVPLREIILSEGAGEPNLPVYDTSGPYTDPAVTIDVNAGLARARIAWVKERGGVEEYQGRDVKPEDNGNVGASACREILQRPSQAAARRSTAHMITQLEFARAGIITKEMIYVADPRKPRPQGPARTRRGGARRRRKLRRRGAGLRHPGIRALARSRAAAPSSPATSTTANSSR